MNNVRGTGGGGAAQRAQRRDALRKKYGLNKRTVSTSKRKGGGKLQSLSQAAKKFATTAKALNQRDLNQGEPPQRRGGAGAFASKAKEFREDMKAKATGVPFQKELNDIGETISNVTRTGPKDSVSLTKTRQKIKEAWNNFKNALANFFDLIGAHGLANKIRPTIISSLKDIGRGIISGNQNKFNSGIDSMVNSGKSALKDIVSKDKTAKKVMNELEDRATSLKRRAKDGWKSLKRKIG